MRFAVLLVACGASPAAEPPHTTVAPPQHAPQPDPALEFGAQPQCTSVRFTGLRVENCYCRHQPRNLANEQCADVFYHRDLRGLLAPRLDAPATVQGGGRVTLHLVFHNASPDPLPLVTGTDFIDLKVHDRTGADVTYVGTCRSGYSHSGEHDLLTLTGGGDIDLGFQWLAAARDECSGRDVPYPPGHYTLVVGTGLVVDAPVATVTATVEIR